MDIFFNARSGSYGEFQRQKKRALSAITKLVARAGFEPATKGL
jgi:hypothetical protein